MLKNIEEVLSNLKGARKRRNKSVVELTAIGTFLHNIYNGVENILKRILKSKSIEIPKSDIWYKDFMDLTWKRIQWKIWLLIFHRYGLNFYRG